MGGGQGWGPPTSLTGYGIPTIGLPPAIIHI
ncbi:MAG: hypothetical protein JWQ89_2130 [Devosia sp.]|nr:hypothetical protein [Devosia sp.]